MPNNPLRSVQPGTESAGIRADGRTAAGRTAGSTPDMQVAFQIVALLEVRGLICPEQSDGVRTGIVAGALDAPDWIAIAQRALALEPCDDSLID